MPEPSRRTGSHDAPADRHADHLSPASPDDRISPEGRDGSPDDGADGPSPDGGDGGDGGDGAGEDFLTRFAVTRRFSLGAPRAFTVSPDGGRVIFLRSEGRDPVTRLWVLDVGTGAERLVADPDALAGGTAEDLPDEERALRERTRERAGGIVAYATDGAARRAVFALSGRLWWADLVDGRVHAIPVAPPVIDPRLDPGGERVAYVRGGAVHTVALDGTGERTLVAPGDTEDRVTYGLPEHVAAEEMGRPRGHWWSPDGSRLLVARVDTTPVQRWYIADPADPARPPREIAYPAAGTPNADVSLWSVGLDGTRTEIEWDRAAHEYLVAVSWTRDPASALIAVQSRDHRVVRVLRADPRTGTTRLAAEERDDDWVQVAGGTPAETASGRLVWISGTGDTYRLTVDGRPVTPPGLQVREVLAVDGETVLVAGSTDPAEIHLWTHDPKAGLVRRTREPGVHDGTSAGGVTVVGSRSAEHDGPRVVVHVPSAPGSAASPGAAAPAAPTASAGSSEIAIGTRTEPLGISPRADLFTAGPTGIRTAVLLPSWHVPGTERLPVLMSPYAGPALQLVLRTREWYFGIAQWFAEHGFGVVIADGRGTPGRGPRWERTVRGDITGPVLEDQITALRAAGERHPDLDLDRVGIRGWSFGGFLAAAAVLRRPDVFHAAVAGAAPTDQRMYDTYWKERYLGHPDHEPGNYRRNSLLPEAAGLRRPLMLIHGLADDNVVAAHTLRLSAALLAAGRPHTVLPLPGATHAVSERRTVRGMFLAQLDFLRGALT